MASYPEYEFKGRRLILIPDDDGNPLAGGALTTPEKFAAGTCSDAHLFSDGQILCFGEQIGTREDLVRVGEANADIGIAALPGLLGPSWER